MEYLNRKHPRLKNYDYSSAGAYFITICTKNRQTVLSEIIDNTVGRGDRDAPCHGIKIRLTGIGKVVDKYINLISENYENVCVDNYVIMPDHIHMLIAIKQWRAGSSRPTAIPQIIGVLKRLINKEIGENIFQASFNDHIVRDENDYRTRWDYIEKNPIKWIANR